MSNEPRSYRESIASVLRDLRPNAEVKIVEQEELERWILRFAPDLAICNQATYAVRSRVPVWVELYPEGRAVSTISIKGRRERSDGIDLSRLLEIVDFAEVVADARE
ncbi:MAG TPA: hypothetical protein VFJ72_12475 [Rubrobacteraceae bacterium]|nr:hypothetical protein [Rubrobacteraceae bacterium]